MIRLRQAWRRATKACDRCATWAICHAVRLYQICMSPLFRGHCRFRPTCSIYFRQSVEKYGAVRGSLRGLRRICRCHPWHPGGSDPA